MRRRFDFDDEEEEEEDKGSSLIFKNLLYLIISLLIAFSVLIIYRASRPRGFDSLFESFDVALEVQQEWLEKTIDDIFYYCDFRKPSNPPRNSARTTVPTAITSDYYWVGAYEALGAENPIIREQIRFKLSQLNKLREARMKKLNEFKNINQSIEESIKKLKFHDPIESIDRVFKAIYRKQCDILICSSIKKDLKRKVERLQALKDHCKQNNFQMEQLPNKIFEILPQESRSDQARKLTSSLFPNFWNNKLAEFETWIESKSAIKWPQTLRKTLSEVSATKVYNNIDLKTADLKLMKKYQDVEVQLFILKQRDVKYNERINEVVDQIKVYDQFIYELLQDMKHTGTISSRTKCKHLHKQSERIKRLKKVYKAGNLQLNLFEAWHRRNLLEIYTNPELIYRDKFGELAKMASREIDEKFDSVWRNGTSAATMFEILSNPSESSGFNLDVALVKYFKLKLEEERQGGLAFPAQQDKVKEFAKKGFAKGKIYPDSMIFSVTALYKQLFNLLNGQKLMRIRREWPRNARSTFLKLEAE